MWCTFQKTQEHLGINRILVLPLLILLVGCSNPNADSAEAKLVIVRGIKECILRNAEGLTTDFCLKVGAKHIVRGLRNSIDFESEQLRQPLLGQGWSYFSDDVFCG